MLEYTTPTTHTHQRKNETFLNFGRVLSNQKNGVLNMKYKTQTEYKEHCTDLIILRTNIRHNEEISIYKKFSESFPMGDGHTVLISDVYDGEEYGLESGKFYPAKVVLNIIKRLQKESKTTPVFHSDFDSLDHHVSYVNSRDYRFVYDIDNLPANFLEAKKLPPHAVIKDGDVSIQG